MSAGAASNDNDNDNSNNNNKDNNNDNNNNNNNDNNNDNITSLFLRHCSWQQGPARRSGCVSCGLCLHIAGSAFDTATLHSGHGPIMRE